MEVINMTKSYSKSKIESLFSELGQYPRYGGTGAGVKTDDLAINNSAKIIEIAQEIFEFCKSLQSNERCDTEKTEAYWRLCDALAYRSRVYFEKSIFFSDTTLLNTISKQKLLENFKSRGSDMNSVYEAVKSLNRLLSIELREYVPFANMYLYLRCNCYRILGDYENAIKDAILMTEFSVSMQDGYFLLSQCYLDGKNYPSAIDAATKAIESAFRPNTMMAGVAWAQRAKIHREIGNFDEAERDDKRYQEIVKDHER